VLTGLSVLAAPFGLGVSPVLRGQRADRTDELRRAASYPLSLSFQVASHSQIEPRYKGREAASPAARVGLRSLAEAISLTDVCAFQVGIEIAQCSTSTCKPQIPTALRETICREICH
jgi:hypothetical protein